MGQEGPKISARFAIVDKVFDRISDALSKKEEADRQKRLQAIKDKGIVQGKIVSYQGHEWIVTWVGAYRYNYDDPDTVRGNGYIDLKRVISGDAVARRSRVDPKKVEVLP